MFYRLRHFYGFYRILAFIGLSAWIGFQPLAMAQYDPQNYNNGDISDLENMPDPQDIPAQPYGMPNQYYPYQQQQGYSPFPVPYSTNQINAQQPQQPPKKQSLLGRLLAPMKKRVIPEAAPPILQIPKEEKDRPRDPMASSDPIIRLGQPLESNGQRVVPGIYLMHLDQTGGAPMLVLARQQNIVLRVPATASGSEMASPAVINSRTPMAMRLPEPPKAIHSTPKNRAAANPDTSSNAPDKPIPRPVEASGRVEASPAGDQLVLVYERQGRIYRSMPISIGN